MKRLLLIICLFGLILNSEAQDTVYVYQENGMIRIDSLYELPMFLTPGQVSYRLRSDDFILKDGLTNKEYNVGTYSEIFNSDIIGFDTQDEAIDYLNMILNRALTDVNIQDQITRPLDLYFTQSIGIPTTLTSITAENDITVDVASVANISVGNYIGIFSGTSGEGHFYFAEVLSINILTLTLDTPVDFAFEIGDPVISSTRDINVNGSVTTEIFTVSNGTNSTITPIDITRIMIQIITTDPPEFSDFGDIATGLTNGIVLRRNNGIMENIFNAKTNGEMSNLMYDLTFYQQTGPLGVNGIGGRMTFSGQAKHGVTIRLNGGDSLDILIQDDLTSLISFRIIAQGHVVED